MEGRSTRSRVTLPDDILQVGQASPFKKARSQKRNRANTSSTTSSTEQPTASEDQSQDGGEPPPRDNEEHVTDGKVGKRSASPPRQDGYGRSTTPNEGRELKRLKTGSSLDGLDTEKPQRESRFLARVKSVTSQKPRSIGHRPNSPPPSPPLGRATSVPIFPSEYSLPQIDLRHPPPSPSRGRSRSPSKSTTPKLTMIPLPSMADSNDFAQGSPEEMSVDTPDVPAEVLLPPPPQEPSTAPSDETLPSINGVQEQSLAKPVSPKVNFSEVVGIKQLETPIVSQDNWLHGVSPLTPAETPHPSTLQATQAPSESVAPLNKLPEKKPIPAPKFTSKLASNLKKAPSAVPSSSSNGKTVAKLPPKTPSFNPLKSATLGKGVASGSKEQPKISDWMVKRTPKPVFSASSSRESSRAPPGRVKTAMKPKQRKEARKSTIPPPLVPLPDEAEDNLAQPPLGDGMATRESAPQSEPEEPSAPSLTAVDETPIDAETAVESQALEADTPGAHSHPVDGYAVLQEPSQVTEHPMTTPVQRAEEPVAPNEPQPVAQSAEEPVVLDEHQPILDDTPASAPAAQPAEETIVPDGPQPMPDDTPAPAAQPAEEPVIPEPRLTPSSALQATEPLDSRDPQITLEQPTPDPGPLLGGEQPMVDVEMGDADVEGKVENGVQPQACDNLPKDPRRSGRSRLPVPRHPSTVASTSRLTRTTRSSSLKQVEKVSKAPEPPRGRQPVSKAPKRAASRARSRAASVAATRAPAEQSEPPASGSSEAAPIGAFDFSKTLDEAPVEVDTNQPNEGRSRANSTGSPMRVASPVRQSPRLRTSISSPTLKPKTPLASPSKSRIPVKRTHSPSPARLVRSASLFSVRPPSRLRDDGSALSSLSNALEKLRKPAPSRPNTSMGFNPDRSDNDMDGPSSSKPHSVQDDSNVGKVSSAALKGKTPAPLGKTSSFGPQHNNKAKFIFPVASGSKPMKQSTLLFGKPGIGRGRPFGVGLGRAPKASRNPGLATVIGSPVKGGGSGSAQEEAMDEDMEPVPSGSAVKIEESPFLDTFIPVEPSEKSKGKQREKGDFTTRRASTVSASLSESIVAFREENAKGKGLMGPPAVPERLSARSAGSSGSPGGVGETSSTPPGRRSTRNAAVAAVAANHAILTKKPAESPKSPVNEALKFLKDCVIYVDVKTEDSEEAGSLFVEMLEGVGARILKQVGQTCTHIVYKNGLQSTINKYNLLRDPKPLVVGIAWVVDCVEQRKKVAEKEYLIDLDEVSLLTNPHKRRRSLLPKPISRSFSDVSMFTESSSRDEPQDGDVSMESTSSVGLDDLTPLERARRRKSMLIGN